MEQKFSEETRKALRSNNHWWAATVLVVVVMLFVLFGYFTRNLNDYCTEREKDISELQDQLVLCRSGKMMPDSVSGRTVIRIDSGSFGIKVDTVFRCKVYGDSIQLGGCDDSGTFWMNSIIFDPYDVGQGSSD